MNHAAQARQEPRPGIRNRIQLIASASRTGPTGRFKFIQRTFAGPHRSDADAPTPDARRGGLPLTISTPIADPRRERCIADDVPQPDKTDRPTSDPATRGKRWRWYEISAIAKSLRPSRIQDYSKPVAEHCCERFSSETDCRLRKIIVPLTFRSPSPQKHVLLLLGRRASSRRYRRPRLGCRPVGWRMPCGLLLRDRP